MATPAPRPEADEVEGTIVFTDLVGFTEFTATRGDAEALQLLAAQDRLVRAELPDAARVVKELGDGLFLWFPHPAAALRCWFTLHRRFDEESSATGLPLWIRVGMHHGRALRRGADLVGHDVNVAARIVDVAAPGEVLVSDSIRAGVDPGADVCFEELGPVVMKGIPDPIRLWRATYA
jgi:adenylate cyclase